MEIGIGAAYESDAPCKKEGVTNLAGDEVFEEQVEALAGHALKPKELVLVPRLKDLDAGMQREHVCFAMQQVEANDRVWLLYAMLLIAMLFQVALQGVLCRFHCSYDKGDDMESSLTGGMIAAYGTNASSGRKYSYGWQKGLWMQGDKAPCYEGLEGWRVYWPTSAKRGFNVHALQVDGHGHCFVFDPGGLYIMLGEASSFSFNPGG
ncbi:hypothetical protein GOP47_0022260 [Adiantum capillus-veneris]|uniref:Uncharacterized protein n=1 Tax=Adiantum capillus-veneris TaxID=13818 RepID=A0A9D4Z607_ADICA|nr:hypothetical protein GOP47_0022260 [Adiantum capillus-veneris]